MALGYARLGKVDEARLGQLAHHRPLRVVPLHVGGHVAHLGVGGRSGGRGGRGGTHSQDVKNKERKEEESKRFEGSTAAAKERERGVSFLFLVKHVKAREGKG